MKLKSMPVLSLSLSMGKRSRKIVLSGLGILMLVLSLAGFIFYRMLTGPALDINAPIQVRISDTDKSVQIAQILKSEYGLKQPKMFLMLAERMNLDKNVKKGRYSLKPGMNMAEIIRVFREGKLKTVDFVIRPQSSLEFFIKRCAEKLEADSIDYAKALKDSSFLTELGFDTASVYGLIIPDTYNLYWHTDGYELLRRMKEEYDNFWNGLRTQQLQHVGLNKQEVSILASIVSKESNKTDELPEIAGLYLNRLRINMPLQADPTVKFALKEAGLQRIYTTHTEYDSPYNTYKNTGLPPGPICIPGKIALDAVLNYSTHNYLFMCAKEDFSGYHNFAEDFKKHKANAAKYRRALDERGIK